MTSILAGVLIALSCLGYVSVGGGLAGGVVFATGLSAICASKSDLYTGKIGFYSKGNWHEVDMLVDAFVGNLLGILIMAILAQGANVELYNNVGQIGLQKLSVSPIQVFFSSILCGILVHMGVVSYKETNNFIPLALCVITFVVCGFNHCIADSFYFVASRENPFKVFGYIIIEVIGNSLGAIAANKCLLER